MLERSGIIRPSREDVLYIDRLNWETERDPPSWQREWLRRAPRLDLAFPVVQTRQKSAHTSNNDNDRSVTFPGGVTSGDLLLAVARLNVGTVTMTFPAGWTELFDVSNGVGNDLRLAAGWRLADGSEGANFALSVSGSTPSVQLVLRITGASNPTVTPPASATTGSAGATNANPPNLTPSWGAKDTLWVAVGATDVVSITAGPASYSNFTVADGIAGLSLLATAERNLNSASENPGTFTNVSDPWIAATLGVSPGAVVPQVMHHRRMMGGH